LDRGVLLGIIVSVFIFIFSLFFIIYINSDFDEQLTDQVDNGISADTLILQIDNETQKMTTEVDRRYEIVVMDRKYWGNGDLASSEDFQYYTENHENDLKMISRLAEIRKKYARREIDEEVFLNSIEQYKEYFKMY
jgi:F0F1-type ATP synthase alpha subunit